MTLLGITTLMILALMIGKRSEEFGLKQYTLIALITLVQVLVAAIEMFTKSVPPYR